MIKKLSIYSSVLIMLSFLLLSISYFYKVYFLQSSLKFNYFSEIVNKDLKHYFIKQVNNNDVKIDIEDITFELKKMPSFFRLNLSNIHVKNKLLNSKIKFASIDFSFLDLVNNIFKLENKFYFGKIKIDNILFSGELNKKGFHPDPMLLFIFDHINKNEIKLPIEKIKNNFEINNIEFSLYDKTNIFNKEALKIKCNNLVFFKKKLNLNCRKSESIEFNLSFLKLNNLHYLNGTITKLDPALINLKKINLNNKINGNISTNYKFVIDEKFHLKKLKLDFLKTSFLDFKNQFLKSEFLPNRKFEFKGGVDLHFDQSDSKDATIKINDLIINKHNKVNGLILKENNIFKSDLKLISSKIDNNLINSFNTKSDYFKESGFDEIQFRHLQNLFVNSKNKKLRNIRTNLSFDYELKTNKFFLKNLTSFGEVDFKSTLTSTYFLKKGSAGFKGKFNFNFFNNKFKNIKPNFKLHLEGSLENINFILINSEKEFVFKKVEVSVKFNSNSIIIDKANLYQNKNVNMSIRANFWKKGREFKISGLDAKIFKLNSELTSEVFRKIKKQFNFMNDFNINSGEIINSNVYLKFKDKKGKKLNKKIILYNLNFKDIDIISKQNNIEVFFEKLKFNYDTKSKFFGESNGFIENIPFNVNFNLTEHFDLSAFGNLDINNEFENLLFKKVNLEIDSLPKINFKISGNLKKEFFETYISGNLKSSLVRSNLLNFYKQKNQEGFFRTTLIFKKSKLTEIKDTLVSDKNSKISSNLILIKKNIIEIYKLQSKNFELEKIIVRKNKDKFNIFVKGDFLDIGYLRKNLEDKKNQINKIIEFDIISPEINLGQNLSLSGNYKGIISKNNINSKVLGKMSLGENPLLDEGELNISVLNNNATLNGKGLVGGAETYIRIKSFKNKLPKIFFQTKDGGKLLERLKFTNKVKSGEMTLEINFLDNSFSNYEGVIRGINFSVINVPGVIKALSSLGFAGINSLFVGQGVGFDEGIAKFTKNNNIMLFEKILINNDRLSIFLNGRHNQENDKINFVGSIAPIKLISKIISVVPAVGELLTGLKKEGIFAGQFKLEGTIDKPNVNLNELSFAPGILRNLFSRDWIKKYKLDSKN